MSLGAGEFGEAWLAFLRQAVADLPPVEPPLLVRVREHLGTDPATLPVVTEGFPVWDHPNVQRALDAWIATEGRSAALLGLAGQHKRHMVLSDLLAPHTAAEHGGVLQLGSVDHVNLDAGAHGTVTCVQFGVYLLADGERRLAVLVRAPTPATARRTWPSRSSRRPPPAPASSSPRCARC